MYAIILLVIISVHVTKTLLLKKVFIYSMALPFSTVAIIRLGTTTVPDGMRQQRPRCVGYCRFRSLRQRTNHFYGIECLLLLEIQKCNVGVYLSNM